MKLSLPNSSLISVFIGHKVFEDDPDYVRQETWKFEMALKVLPT